VGEEHSHSRTWVNKGEPAVVATGGAHERVSDRDVQERPDVLSLMKQEWWVVDHQGLHELEERAVGHIVEAAVDEQPASGPVVLPQKVGLPAVARRDEAQDVLNRAFAIVVLPYRRQDGSSVTFHRER
jgi:hypothetical protein